MLHVLALAVLVRFPGIDGASPVHPVSSRASIAVPADVARETWALLFSDSTYDYEIVAVRAGRHLPVARGGPAPIEPIALPPWVHNGDRLEISATFAPAFGDRLGVRFAPLASLRDQRADRIVLALFAGFFFAMTLVNVMGWFTSRSSASAWYCGLSSAMAFTLIYLLGWLRPLYGGVPPIHQLLHTVGIGAFLVCVAGFGMTLLDGFRRDRVLSIAVIAVCAFNLVLLAGEDVFGSGWPLYTLDEVALDSFLAAMALLGARAFIRGDRTVAGLYLIAFLGPFAGIPLNDLTKHNIIGQYWVTYSFEAGVAWEASFFAYAVALRNRSLRSERDRLDRLAHLDQLTGVANRRTFDERLAAAWTAASQHSGTLALAMVDIDRFKSLNDERGHRYGDEVLRTVAAACAGVSSREGDCFARYGGEEFAAILVGTDFEGGSAVAERMRRAVEETALATVSIGLVATVPNPAYDAG